MQRGIAILGSTGSIGRSTLAVIALHPEQFKVAVLGAFNSWKVIVEQAREFNAETVVLVDPEAAACAPSALRELGPQPRAESAEQALAECASAATVRTGMATNAGR